MDLNIAKTLIASYKYFSKVCGKLDQLVNQRALSSGRYTSNNIKYYDAFQTASDLMMLSDRKVELINLKISIDKALLQMKAGDAKLLIHRFIYDEKFVDLATKLGTSERNIFRVSNKACEKFLEKMQTYGYGEKEYEEIFSHHKWLGNFLDQFASKTTKQVNVVRFSPKLFERAMSQYSYALYG